MSKPSPLLQQYFEIKAEYPDTLLLFQVGDFYELFFEDAQTASAFLGITLTKRGTYNQKPVPLCGVPIHTLDHYLIKLIRGGFKVALCDQLELARPGKLVARGVTQVLTPGTLTDARMIDEKHASYCVAIYPQPNGDTGIAAAELLTGQLFATTISANHPALLDAELARFSPDEILLPLDQKDRPLARQIQKTGYCISWFDATSYQEIFNEWLSGNEPAVQTLVTHSPTISSALLLLIGFLKQNQERALAFTGTLSLYTPYDFLMLDAATQKNLELFPLEKKNKEAQTLFQILDQCVTAMGSRQLKKWIVRPSQKITTITERLSAITTLKENLFTREHVAQILQHIGDLERITGRILLQRNSLRDLIQLRSALLAIKKLTHTLSDIAENPYFAKLKNTLFDFSPLTTFLQKALTDDPNDQWHIRPGYNQALDQAREQTQNGAYAIAQFEASERKRTGISSLKIKFNRIQGYAIELTKAQSASAPQEYSKLQTLVNATRYTTPELQQLEYQLQTAEEQAQQLDKQIYEELIQMTLSFGPHLRKSAQTIAIIDSLYGLTSCALTHNWVAPKIKETGALHIQQGKHPVVAAHLGNEFVPNSTTMDTETRTWIITGPNMGGKSTYLRQVALIVLLAHIGSYVPASYAEIPCTDRIFTRIGASDNVTAGKSTFLVEMEETALICNHATKNSLVILDEVGRGTSTYDGLAIAQAVVEYLHTHIQAKALFATHFHEITELCKTMQGIVAYHAASIQTPEGILLLHKIEPGCAQGSFGLEVARQAQLPSAITQRAEHLLTQFTKQKQEPVA